MCLSDPLILSFAILLLKKMNKPPKKQNQKQTSDQSVSLPSLLLFSFLFHFPSGGSLCLVSRKTVQSPAGSHSRTVAYMALHVVLNTHFSASVFFYCICLFVCFILLLSLSKLISKAPLSGARLKSTEVITCILRE